MRLWLLRWLLFILVVLPVQARAQSAVRFSTVEIELRPEFDRPNLLVIYRMTLAADVQLPASLTLRIPVEAARPHVIAIGANLNQVSDQGITSKLETSGDWVNVTFTAQQPAIWFEYYDPRLTQEKQERQFTYIWPADLATDDLVITVQEPAEAADFQVLASPVSVITGNDGLRYYTIGLGKVDAAQPYQLSVDYKKASNRLTFEGLPVQAASPLPSSDPTKWLPWALGILGMTLIIGGVVWFRVQGHNRQDASSRKKHPRSSKDSTAATSDEAGYCSQCGRRSTPGDRFCRSCGTELRIE